MNDDRPHQSLRYRTPCAVFEGSVSNHVDNVARRPHDYSDNSKEKVLTNVEGFLYLRGGSTLDREGQRNAMGLSLKSPRFLCNRWRSPYILTETFMKPEEQNSHLKPIGTDAPIRPVAPEASGRLKVFYRFLPAVSAFFRRRRMKSFVRILKIKPGTRVLDLGGSPQIWEHVSVPLEITLLNLPGAIKPGELKIFESPGLRHHRFHVIEGDACHVEQFGDHLFDLVFSNSVIEHVGPPAKQEAFAHEVLRLGRSHWVQTPSKWFPIEAHSGLPFYWFYPKWLQAAVMRRWRRRLPAWWADYIGTTTVLSRRRMAELFPNSQTRIDYFFGLPKSYVSHSRE